MQEFIAASGQTVSVLDRHADQSVVLHTDARTEVTDYIARNSFGRRRFWRFENWWRM